MNAAEGDVWTPERACEVLRTLEAELGQAVIGQRLVVRQLVIALVAAGHVLVEGLPGMGKTLLVRALAKALGGHFARVQFTPDLMPSDLTGHVMYDMKSETFRVRKGPVFCNFLMADEINRAPAKTQAALLEVMQEQQVSFEGRSYEVPRPFLVLATQNPVEQEGTYPLPQAQLDRFLINVIIDYPEADDELAIVSTITRDRIGEALDVSGVGQICGPDEVFALQQVAARLQADPEIIDYAVSIVRATRNWNGIETGAGPRGALALMRAARAHTLINGRDYVTPDDVKTMATGCLRHRLKLTADLEIEGYLVDQVLENLLETVEAPRQ